MDNFPLQTWNSKDVYTLMKAPESKFSSSSTDQSTNLTDSQNPVQLSAPKLVSNYFHLQKTDLKLHVTSRTSRIVPTIKKLLENMLKINWSAYIQWKALLSCGLGLWIALCIADKSYLQSSFPKTKKILDLAEELAINLNTNCEDKNPVLNGKSFWSKIYWEVYILMVILGVVICGEIRLRMKSQTKNSSKNPSIEDCSVSEVSECSFDEVNLNSGKVKLVPLERLHLNTDLNCQWRISEAVRTLKRPNNGHCNELGERNVNRSAWSMDRLRFYVCEYILSKIGVISAIQSVNKLPRLVGMNLNKFIEESQENLSSVEKIRDLTRTRIKNNTQRKPSKGTSVLFTNEMKNNRIISSSSAFKQFLLLQGQSYHKKHFI